MSHNDVKKWQSSPHPISDVRDWKTAGRLEVQPDFQRREVWSAAARIMLIDTILQSIPMPKMFVWNEMVNASTHRRVIDGQQRISAILDFLESKFSLDPPYKGPHLGKYFKDLPASVQDEFLHYQIDFNEAKGFSEKEVREVYSRVNKYSMPLNKQELRQADYPGNFLALSSDLSIEEYLDENRVFTPANRRRMGDVEFVSEILAGMLEGPQDKKGDLDYFYMKYAEWPLSEVGRYSEAFVGVLNDLKVIFPSESWPLRVTRFRQKADFYSLFLAVYDLQKSGHSLTNKDIEFLTRDLQLLDKHIAPESSIPPLREYAIKCVSQANSQGSRAWRRNFLTSILSGTYRSRKPTGSILSLLGEIREGADEGETLFDECVVCHQERKIHSDGRILDWPPDATVFQITNLGWRGNECFGADK